jgi:uncharacterized SAM-binding protein YcdF (DUF218 family)
MKILCKKNIGIIYLIAGLLSFINGVAAKYYSVSFSSFFLVISIPLIALGCFEVLILNKNTPKPLKVFISTIHIGTLLLIISFIIIESLIITSAIKRENKKPDYIVILGAGLRGEIPSHTLYKRLETSLNLINEYKDVKIILSGGQGPGETITEAEAMKRYLLEKGVSSDRIIKEDKSTSTLENLEFTKNIITSLESKTNPKITIVTSNFHMFRSKILAGRVGFSSYGYPAEILPSLIPTYFIREYMALIKTLIFDWPTK